MDDIKPNDRVFGMDGQLHAVKNIDPEKLCICWKLTFDDGATIICDDEQPWLTFDAKELEALTKRTDEFRAHRRQIRPIRVSGRKSEKFSAALAARNAVYTPPTIPAPKGTVRRTADIVSTLKTARGRTNHAIPVSESVHLPKCDLILDPYLLGLWLGDGNKDGGGFTTSDDLWKAFKDAGFEVMPSKASRYHYGIHGLVPYLRELNIFNNKHIPADYLWTTEEQRLALLQGLMDTDGNCNKNGSVEFVNTNKNLVDGVAFLLRSLGVKCNVRESRAKLKGRDCGPKWSIKCTPSCIVFRLLRKAERQKLTNRRTTKLRYIVSAVQVESRPMKRFSIDSSDSLFLAGESFIVMHC